MRQSDLSVDKELLQVALIIFSAVSLATLEFIRNAFPDIDAVQVPKTAVVYTIILVLVVPALMLFLLDRAIAARDKSGRALRVFRTGLFAVVFLLILRQLQLYWDPGADVTEAVRSASPVLLVAVGLAVFAGVVGLCIRLFSGVLLFFYYMSPVAIVMTAILPFQVPTGDGLPEAYGQEVVTATRSESKPAVFILIFDGLGYDVLVEDGKLDAESFPNIAALAEDGVSFTNATSNYFWSFQAVPAVIMPVTRLSEQFDVRLYSQYPVVENGYIKDCGEVYTCRGVGYLTDSNRLLLAANLALRSFYQATPKTVETVISGPMGWLVGILGSAYPPVDRSGWHTFTKKQFDVFLNDIEGREALGRIYALHLLLPHHPFAFNENGKAVSGRAADSEGYRNQSIFVDSLVGKLIDKLKQEGIYDRAVIVVTADHGTRPFTPSPERPPDQFTPHVPLVIRAPGLDSHVSEVDYQHIDFGPTLADVLGLPMPNDTQGVSAFSQDRPQRDKLFSVNQWTFVYSQEDDTWQFSQKE